MKHKKFILILFLCILTVFSSCKTKGPVDALLYDEEEEIVIGSEEEKIEEEQQPQEEVIITNCIYSGEKIIIYYGEDVDFSLYSFKVLKSDLSCTFVKLSSATIEEFDKSISGESKVFSATYENFAFDVPYKVIHREVELLKMYSFNSTRYASISFNQTNESYKLTVFEPIGPEMYEKINEINIYIDNENSDLNRFYYHDIVDGKFTKLYLGLYNNNLKTYVV